MHFRLHSSEQPKAHPINRFTATKQVAAFRYMQQAKQIGKIVITIPEGQSFDQSYFRADGTYLITGGLGGLGLAIAEWMVARGVRSLTSLSRHMPNNQIQEKLDRLRNQGAQVLTFAVDVANQEALANVFINLKETVQPLCGVIHAAGVLADAVLTKSRLGEI